MKRSNSIAVLAEALAKAQAELKDSKVNKEGYGYKYADLASVLSDVRKVFSKYKLSFTQEVTQNESHIVVNTLLMHGCGEWIEYETCIPCIEMKGCNEAQSAGAGMTYARRYAISAIAGIASEEDVDASSEPKLEPKSATKTETLFHAMLKRIEQISNIFELTNWEKKHAKEIAALSEAEGATIARALANKRKQLKKATQQNEPKKLEPEKPKSKRQSLIESIKTLAENQGQIREAIYKVTGDLDLTLEKCSFEVLQKIEEYFLKKESR